MKKIILYALMIVFSLSCTEIYANVSRASSLKKTLSVKYTRFSKAPTGKIKILKDIDNLSKKYSKDNDVILMLKNIKSIYRVATECDIGSYLKEGQCISMAVVDNGINLTNEGSNKSVSTECTLGKYLKNGKCIEMVVSSNEVNTDTKNTISTTKGNKLELEAKIKETEALISSSKATYTKSQQVIQAIQGSITTFQLYNTQYESKIAYTRSDYQYYINKAKTDKDAEKQQLNVFYARSGIYTTDTAGYDAIDSKYDKLIADLEYEMNNNVNVYQNYINSNNNRINELQIDLADRTKGLEVFGESIKKVEKNLEMYISELAML